MLPLLAVSLKLCLVSMPGEEWAKILPPKIRDELVVANLFLAILLRVSCPFYKMRDWSVKSGYF